MIFPTLPLPRSESGMVHNVAPPCDLPMASRPVFETDLSALPLLGRGKVRDLYAIDAAHMLLVATDRLSAFDVVLPTPIAGKGRILTALSEFWFERLQALIPHHCRPLDLEALPLEPEERAMLAGRSLRVRRLEPLPVEAVVRGHLIGSGWQDYQRQGQVCGIPLPAGLRLAERLPEPLFTPATKAAPGAHDENIDFEQAAALLGRRRAEEVRDLSLRLYAEASAYARERGIIIADTKFEFGLDAQGALVLIDEVLTPDSSRFWDAEHWRPGENPYSFDKQFVRDWLAAQAWDRRPPGPAIPDDIAARTAERYRQIGRRLCGAQVPD